MALTQLDYPVTGTEGTFRNVFPSQKPLNVNFKRIDNTIDSIVSGTGGLVQLNAVDDFDSNLVAGDFITWKSDGYSLRTSKIVEVENSTDLLVDEIFNSGDASNGTINYRKNWFLEARFVNKGTATDQQDNAVLLIDDFSQVPSSLEGDVSLDLSIVKDVLSANIDISTGLAEGLSQVFKFQFRESYEDNREALWQSPSLAPFGDMEIMLVLASQEVVFNDFTNASSGLKRFYKSYPTMFSYIYSDINDAGVSDLTFNLSQYTLSKTLITTNEVASFSDVSSVINILVPDSDIDDNAVFIRMEATLTSNNSQYDPSQYDPSQYA